MQYHSGVYVLTEYSHATHTTVQHDVTLYEKSDIGYGFGSAGNNIYYVHPTTAVETLAEAYTPQVEGDKVYVANGLATVVKQGNKLVYFNPAVNAYVNLSIVVGYRATNLKPKTLTGSTVEGNGHYFIVVPITSYNFKHSIPESDFISSGNARYSKYVVPISNSKYTYKGPYIGHPLNANALCYYEVEVASNLGSLGGTVSLSPEWLAAWKPTVDAPVVVTPPAAIALPPPPPSPPPTVPATTEAVFKSITSVPTYLGFLEHIKTLPQFPVSGVSAELAGDYRIVNIGEGGQNLPNNLYWDIRSHYSADILETHVGADNSVGYYPGTYFGFYLTVPNEDNGDYNVFLSLDNQYVLCKNIYTNAIEARLIGNYAVSEGLTGVVDIGGGDIQLPTSLSDWHALAITALAEPLKYSDYLVSANIPKVILGGVPSNNQDKLTLVGAYAPISTDTRPNRLEKVSVAEYVVFDSTNPIAKTTYEKLEVPVSFVLNPTVTSTEGYYVLVYKDSLSRVYEKEITVPNVAKYTSVGVVKPFAIPKTETVVFVGLSNVMINPTSISEFRTLLASNSTISPHVVGTTKSVYLGIGVEDVSIYAHNYDASRPVLSIYDTSGTELGVLDYISVAGTNYTIMPANTYKVFKFDIPSTLATLLNANPSYSIRVHFATAVSSAVLPITQVAMSGVNFVSASTGVVLADVDHNAAPVLVSVELGSVTKEVSTIKYTSHLRIGTTTTNLSPTVIFSATTTTTVNREIILQATDVGFPVVITRVTFQRSNALASATTDYIVTGMVSASSIPTTVLNTPTTVSLSPLTATKELTFNIAFRPSFKQLNPALLLQNKRNLAVKVYGTIGGSSTEVELLATTLMATVS